MKDAMELALGYILVETMFYFNFKVGWDILGDTGDCYLGSNLRFPKLGSLGFMHIFLGGYSGSYFGGDGDNSTLAGCGVYCGLLSISGRVPNL